MSSLRTKLCRICEAVRVAPPPRNSSGCCDRCRHIMYRNVARQARQEAAPPEPVEVEPTEAELDAMIAEQRRCLPAWWYDDDDDEPTRAGKLTPAKVIEIRYRREAGEKLLALAEEFGVSKTQISRIALGKVWQKV